jgi:hypothetical protein
MATPLARRSLKGKTTDNGKTNNEVGTQLDSTYYLSFKKRNLTSLKVQQKLKLPECKDWADVRL